MYIMYRAKAAAEKKAADDKAAAEWVDMLVYDIMKLQKGCVCYKLLTVHVILNSMKIIDIRAKAAAEKKAADEKAAAVWVRYYPLVVDIIYWINVYLQKVYWG